MLSGFLIYTVSGMIAWQFPIPENKAIKRMTNDFIPFLANIRKIVTLFVTIFCLY